MRVLRTSGVESESPLAFAALQRLLWPLRGRDRVAARRRSAPRCSAAMGEAEGEGDRFLAFLGTLSLLADAAEDAPVLAVVDDAHWLDDASTAALLFVARRLQDERIALLFAARDGDARSFEAPDLPTVVLGGVGDEAASAILSRAVRRRGRRRGVRPPRGGHRRQPARPRRARRRPGPPTSWPAGLRCRPSSRRPEAWSGRSSTASAVSRSRRSGSCSSPRPTTPPA